MYPTTEGLNAVGASLPPCDTEGFGGRCIFLKIFGSSIYFSKIKED
jgi:hypothetical protein